MTAAARGPLTLRDFLELACDSSSDGFRSYPRRLPRSDDDDDALQAPAVRLLVEADLRRSPSRSPSSLFSLARISSLSRSFSRRIKEGFWRRREEEEEEDDLYFDERDSCGFPSPLVSSCSASDSESEYAAESQDRGEVGVAIDEETACPPASECEKPSSSSSSSSADHDCTDGAPGAAADGKKMQADGDPAVVGRGKLGMEDKQQLSPVSVLDFPFDDDDGDERSDAGTCSPSFQRCPCPCPPPPDLLHTRTTTKQPQLLHKIRRYDGIAREVDAVDLEARFTATTSVSGESGDASTHLATTSSCTDATSSSVTTTTAAPRHGEEHQSVEWLSREEEEEEEEPDEYRLLAQLLQEDTAAAVDEISQVLVLDFFAEGIERLRSSAIGSAVVAGMVRPLDDGRRGNKVPEALVAAAAEWLRGAGPQWGIRDVMLSGKAALEDMQRGRRRWMCMGEEERDVGAAVEGFVMDGLVDELVEELVPAWWHGDGRRWSC